MHDFVGDLRYALRGLVRQPGFTIVAAMSLALGIGLNTTIFSVVNAVLLRDLPIEDPDRLVEIYTGLSEDFPHLTTSFPDLVDVRAEADTFEGLAAHAMVRGIVTNDGRSELVAGEVVTANYFDLLGIRPAIGRAFHEHEDETEGTHPVMILSHGLWQRRLGGDADVVGKTLRLSSIDYTVIGVAPVWFSGTIPGLRPEFWVPTAMVESLSFSGIAAMSPSPTGDTRRTRRGERWLFVKGRLAPGVTPEEAQAQVSTIFARLSDEYPETNEDVTAAVLSGDSVRFHPMLDNILATAGAVLLAAVGMVLLIACANVANMLLARAAGRSREIAVRLSVGASRSRLVRQLMTESFLLATLGGVFGVGIAFWALRLLAAVQPPLPVPIEFAYELDASVMAFTFGVSVVTALVFGLVPALRASRPSLVPALKGEAGAGDEATPRRFSLSKALVVGQLAVSLVLLVAGTLLTRGLIEAGRTEVGFDSSRIAVFGFNLQMNNYTLEEATTLQRELLAQLPTLPGVEYVSTADRMPLSPDMQMTVVFVPGVHETEEDAPPVDRVTVGEDYFRVTGIPILRGRAFDDDLDQEGSPSVVIANETMAELYWPDRSPIGERVYQSGPDGPPTEIIGVSADHKVRSLGEEPRPYIHFPRSQSPSRATDFIIRTSGPAASVLPSIRREILAMEPEIVFTEESTASEVVELTLVPARIGARLLGAFGALALLLAAVGLYGVIAYAVAGRTQEVGLRMALGANGPTVLKMILRQGMVLAILGVGVGAVLAALLARVLQALLYGVSSVDPVSYGVAALVLLVVALAANLIPAWRASRISPLAALRYE